MHTTKLFTCMLPYSYSHLLNKHSTQHRSLNSLPHKNPYNQIYIGVARQIFSRKSQPSLRTHALYCIFVPLAVLAYQISMYLNVALQIQKESYSKLCSEAEGEVCIFYSLLSCQHADDKKYSESSVTILNINTVSLFKSTSEGTYPSCNAEYFVKNPAVQCHHDTPSVIVLECQKQFLVCPIFNCFVSNLPWS